MTTDKIVFIVVRAHGGWWDFRTDNVSAHFSATAAADRAAGLQAIQREVDAKVAQLNEKIDEKQGDDDACDRLTAQIERGRKRAARLQGVSTFEQDAKFSVEAVTLMGPRE